MTRYQWPDAPAPVRTRKDGSTFVPHIWRLYRGRTVVLVALAAFAAGVLAALLLPVVL